MTTPACNVYCFSGSPFVWRVLIALEEKGIAHERTWLPRGEWNQKRGEMLDKNPRGRLPIVQWGDQWLYESMAICEFLELEQPEPRLVPTDSAARARTLMLAYEVENYFVPAVMPALDAGLFRPPGTALPDADRALNRKLHEELAQWEKHLSGGAPYLAGDAFTLADIALFPLVAFGVRCELKLAPELPKLAAWYARIEPRESVQSGWPPHWREGKGRDIGLNER